MKNHQNILVVRTDRIGDVVLTNPALRALRQNYPDAKITLLVNKQIYALVSKNSNVDEIMVDDPVGIHKGLLGYLKLIRSIKDKHFDLSIIYHTKKRINLLCFMAGIPVRLGFKNNKFGFLLTHPLEDQRHLGKKHEAQYCLDVLKPLGIENTKCDLEVSLNDDANQWLAGMCEEHGIITTDLLIAVHPGASDPSKRWPPQRFAECIDQLAQRGPAKFVIIGTKDIQPVSKKLVELCQAPCTDLTGKTNLSQLASLIKRCNLLISNDSGPVHIASALETPVVSIFTRNQPGINPARWHPLGNLSKYVSVPVDTEVSFKKAGTPDPKYLEMITTQEVLEAVDSIFKVC